MNKLRKQILKFKQRVGFYLKNEYKPKYYRTYKMYPMSVQHIVESYYMGGNNVPNTAHDVVVCMVKNNLV